MEKFLENIQEAEKTIRTLDHLIYVTFPLIKDKKLLLSIILEAKKAIATCINSILQYEYLYKRVNLYKDPLSNFRTFKEKCAPRYQITSGEIKLILELFDLVEKHKKSTMEFIRKERVIILSENLEQKTISFEGVKEFVILAKSILTKARKNFNPS